jgi:CheY-like chemotaxis protein
VHASALSIEERLSTMPLAQILIAEDEMIVVMELQARLKDAGYAVAAVATSGKEAVEKALQTRPDLVLMDIRLKGEMNGIETARAIQAHLDIPVVYLTALADNDTLQRVKIRGPLYYVVKPFNEKDLLNAIEKALQEHKPPSTPGD